MSDIPSVTYPAPPTSNYVTQSPYSNLRATKSASHIPQINLSRPPSPTSPTPLASPTPTTPHSANFLSPYSNTQRSRSRSKSRDRPREPDTDGGDSRQRRPASAPPTTLAFDLSQEQKYQPRHPRGRETNSIVGSSFSSVNAPGALLKPPPPLFRPTTFWRKEKNSGVAGASYSPSSYIIRRSTFVAAGLTLDKPVADLSALCVESRVDIVYLPADSII